MQTGWTALLVASYWGHTSVVKYLAGKGADVYAKLQVCKHRLNDAAGE